MAARTPDRPRKPPRERTLALDLVVPLEETSSVRSHGVDPEHVELMVPFVAELPPVDVVALTEGRFGLLSGYHRVEAHRRTGRVKIRVTVHDLPETEERFRFAVRSNVKHGRPLTRAERQRAVEKMLDGDRSDRAIAEDCGVSHQTVGRVREQQQMELRVLEGMIEAAAWSEVEPRPRGPDSVEGSTGEIPQRVGRDGRLRRLPQRRLPSPFKSQFLKVCLGDVTSLANVIENIRDTLPRLDPWERGQVADRLPGVAERLASLMEAASEVPEPPD